MTLQPWRVDAVKDYFGFPSDWVAYMMFMVVPWFVGRHLQDVP